MRNAFAAEMTKIAGENEDVVLLSGDIGNKLFDKYKAVAPDRFFNCGVAEGNMVSAAAGMALCGLRPVAYTITPFITARCLEQIKLDLCYHNVPVIVVGVGGGLSYASLGATHHSFEDLAILRALPGLTIICPGDAHEVRLAVRESLKLDGPVYIRLGKKGEPVIHQEEPQFKIGSSITVKEGNDLSIVSTGNMLPTALECAAALAEQSISCEVVSFHTVKPLDEPKLRQVFGDMSLVVSIEEHSVIGGLGAAIAEWKCRQEKADAQLLSFGVADEFIHEAGNQKHARQYFGLTPGQIVPQIVTKLKERARV